MEIKEVEQRSTEIREQYHQLKIKQDGHPWTTEQDALAFLTDAALVGRQVMAQTGSWPDNANHQLLTEKIGESVWWLSVLATENGIDFNDAVTRFLQRKAVQFKR
ncbi:MazG-like protein [Lactiplantibacillus sp. DA1]|uniref:MazG-like protein n=1 Tax=Lactiplantibacillus sp. DA1 TaxID=3079857 RepID=UPI00292A5FB8|nr:MazG-like protein [Lactiplantibacillus sp. DA1]MDV0430507.1 MazG-like protein [Lactiplantibacillus sp. DA1]